MNTPVAVFGASPSIDIDELIDVSTLSIGMHTLGIRIKDVNNVWSIPEYIPVFVTLASATIVSNITKAEYFFDTDPGFDGANPISFPSTQNLDINEMFPTGGLSLGMHTLNIRIKNEFDEWSIAESIPVYVDQNQQITQLEHFYDTDPGASAATNVPVAPPTNNLDVDLNLPTASLANGPHTLAVRLAGINDIWGVTEYIPFAICTGAIANFSAITTCIGDVTNFADLSTNVLGGDTYSWDFDGDLVEDDNTIGSTSFTYTTTGSYNAALTIDRSGCPSIISMNVDVVDQPTASAGLDQTICDGNAANLSGTI